MWSKIVPALTVDHPPHTYMLECVITLRYTRLYSVHVPTPTCLLLGRMLTIFALYVSMTGDSEFILEVEHSHYFERTRTSSTTPAFISLPNPSPNPRSHTHAHTSSSNAFLPFPSSSHLHPHRSPSFSLSHILSHLLLTHAHEALVQDQSLGRVVDVSVADVARGLP